MAIIKCKMCGGDLNLTEGSSVAECEYCGSRQTVPSADSEKKLNLFERANRLRTKSDFDGAAQRYEDIITDYPEEAEAYWGLILCKYGIEYVDDPATGKKIPTCHRSSFDSVMDEENFNQVMKYGDPISRRVYLAEAQQIETLRKGILEVSSKEEPCDIFICYKETDEYGGMTPDTELAQRTYDMLTEEGYRVFFSRISLEDKLGEKYEPYIFAALNSAKIMLVFCTKPEYCSAVWVKNEWSRFLKLMAKGEKKLLIPCYKNMDIYDLPEEFISLQAQDMGKPTAYLDLKRSIKRLLPKEPDQSASAQPVPQIIHTVGPNDAAILDLGYQELEHRNWNRAIANFESVLRSDSRNAEAFIGLLCAEKQEVSLDYLKRKLISKSTLTDSPARMAVAVDRSKEENLIRALCVPNYLTEEPLRELFRFDFTVPDLVTGPAQRLADIKRELDGNDKLQRAKQFAKGELVDRLRAFESGTLAPFRDRLSAQQQALRASQRQLRENYAAMVAEKEPSARAIHENALAARDRDLRQAAEMLNRGEFKDAEMLLERVGSYQNAPALLELCRAELDLAALRRRMKQVEDKHFKAEAFKTRQLLMYGLIGILGLVMIAAILMFNSGTINASISWTILILAGVGIFLVSAAQKSWKSSNRHFYDLNRDAPLDLNYLSQVSKLTGQEYEMLRTMTVPELENRVANLRQQ